MSNKPDYKLGLKKCTLVENKQLASHWSVVLSKRSVGIVVAPCIHQYMLIFPGTKHLHPLSWQIVTCVVEHAQWQVLCDEQPPNNYTIFSFNDVCSTFSWWILYVEHHLVILYESITFDTLAHTKPYQRFMCRIPKYQIKVWGKSVFLRATICHHNDVIPIRQHFCIEHALYLFFVVRRHKRFSFVTATMNSVHPL